MTKTSAVVLAGGKATDEIRQLTGVTNRALLPIGDRTMLDYVVDALTGAQTVGDIVVVGDVPRSARYAQIDDHGSLFDNLLAGLNAAGEDHCLVSTSDIPFITADAVDDFVRAATSRAVDIAYPIVEMRSYQDRFGEMKRTTVKLREGIFTGGNMMLLRTEFVTRQPERIQQAYAARKDVLRLGTMLGPGLLLRLIVSQTIAPSALSLSIAEAAAARALGHGTTVAAVVTPYPEIGTDVDKPADIEIARRMLGGATPAPSRTAGP